MTITFNFLLSNLSSNQLDALNRIGFQSIWNDYVAFNKNKTCPLPSYNILDLTSTSTPPEQLYVSSDAWKSLHNRLLKFSQDLQEKDHLIQSLKEENNLLHKENTGLRKTIVNYSFDAHLSPDQMTPGTFSHSVSIDYREYSDMKDKISSLETDNRSLREKYTSLGIQFDKLWNVSKERALKNDSLKKENKELEEKYNTCEKNYTAIWQETVTLGKENAELRKENEKLNTSETRYTDLWHENCTLLKDNTRLNILYKCSDKKNTELEGILRSRDCEIANRKKIMLDQEQTIKGMKDRYFNVFATKEFLEIEKRNQNLALEKQTALHDLELLKANNCRLKNTIDMYASDSSKTKQDNKLLLDANEKLEAQIKTLKVALDLLMIIQRNS